MTTLISTPHPVLFHVGLATRLPRTCDVGEFREFSGSLLYYC